MNDRVIAGDWLHGKGRIDRVMTSQYAEDYHRWVERAVNAATPVESLTWATLAGAAATMHAAVIAHDDVTLTGEVLCGAEFTQEGPNGELAECELPDGHDGGHAGHVLGTFRFERDTPRLDKPDMGGVG